MSIIALSVFRTVLIEATTREHIARPCACVWCEELNRSMSSEVIESERAMKASAAQIGWRTRISVRPCRTASMRSGYPVSARIEGSTS